LSYSGAEQMMREFRHRSIQDDHAWSIVVYGAVGGIVTVLIRNIGVYADGVLYAILVINLIQPLVDKIRPQAVGKVV